MQFRHRRHMKGAIEHDGEKVPFTCLLEGERGVIADAFGGFGLVARATIAACLREFGWKKALAIAFVDIALALLLGGIAYRVLSLIMAG